MSSVHLNRWMLSQNFRSEPWSLQFLTSVHSDKLESMSKSL
ncbi:UNVERIFIED_ORG: hypothetical protein GGD59_006586 [Rhizobium esperanzae]